jgi:O-antigen/teichoic acid export membrane protein
MMQKKQIIVNAAMSILQIIVIGGSLFILYRFFLNTIGVEQLGVWSLVLAVASSTQIANFGLSGSVVKFVAKYISRGEYNLVSDVIQTAALSVGVFVAIFFVIFYPVVHWLLGFVAPLESLHFAQSLLPYAMFAFWLMIITSVFQAGLDGYQRIDIRTSLIIGGAIVNLVLCFILVPIYGLFGIAYSLVIQNLSVLVGSWVMLKKLLPEIPIVPIKWNKPIFKEIVGYGVNFQVISVTTMLYDPITKILLTKFGGLALTGYFEMASKMVQQFRAIIASANQVLVPAIADMKEKEPGRIRNLYLSSYRLLFYLATPLFSMIIISIPIISVLWIGHFEPVFVSFSIILSIGWYLNTLNTPAYFAYLGIGSLRWNVIAHVVIAILNIVLGFIGGIYFNGIGVVVSWAVSLVIGSSIISFTYCKKNGIPLSEYIPKESRLMTVFCSIFTLVSITVFLFSQNINCVSTFSKLFLGLFLIIIIVLMGLHPMRKLLFSWVMEDIFHRNKHK